MKEKLGGKEPNRANELIKLPQNVLHIIHLLGHVRFIFCKIPSQLVVMVWRLAWISFSSLLNLDRSLSCNLLPPLSCCQLRICTVVAVVVV